MACKKKEIIRKKIKEMMIGHFEMTEELATDIVNTLVGQSLKNMGQYDENDRGKHGHIAEDICGISHNNKQEPDIDGILEVKTSVLREKKTKPASIERLTVTDFNIKNDFNIPFHNSHIHKKTKLMLIAGYKRFTKIVQCAKIIQFSDRVLKKMEKDYNERMDLIKNNVPEWFSGRYGDILTMSAKRWSLKAKFTRGLYIAMCNCEKNFITVEDYDEKEGIVYIA